MTSPFDRAKLNIPYPAVDPLNFLVDEEIRPFFRNHRHDLTGTGRQACPTESTGVFIVHEHTVAKNECEVVHGIFPHCWQRANAESDQESVELIDPMRLAGFVLFTPKKDNGVPYEIEHDFNAPTIQTTPNDRDRQVVSGFTFLSADAPMTYNLAMRNPLTDIYLPGGAKFRVLFRLAPLASTSTVPGAAETPIPNPFTIGENPVAGAPNNNRIDCAGALVFGVRMPQEMYGKLLTARRAGLLGPEAARLLPPTVK